MIEIWYVVWMLLGASGEQASPPQFMSGPYPSVEECVQAGEAADYPSDAEVLRVQPRPGVYVVTVGCVQIKTELDPEPVDHSKDVTT